MYIALKPKFQNELSKETEDKIKRSEAETSEMQFRPIYCPYCKNHIVDVFEDFCEHIYPDYTLPSLLPKGANGMLMNPLWF